MAAVLLNSSPQAEVIILAYRITGKQSVERLEPLLPLVHEKLRFQPISNSATNVVDFVWETYCEKSYRDLHNGAKVLNRLHNSCVLESKSNLAYIGCLVQSLPRTYVARTKTDALEWMERKWLDKDNDDDNEWWVVKSSTANGGRDVYVVHDKNYRVVGQQLPEEEMVIQRYVQRPLLLQGRKFHFRCYALLKGDLAAYLHEYCFLLTSSLDYDMTSSCATSPASFDDYASQLRRHVTNLSINKKYPHHPGQIPCLLSREYPMLWSKLKLVYGTLVQAVHPYMAEQRSSLHFDFYGLDLIADEDGELHLLEVNRLPGLESSQNNRQAEDLLYDRMMLQALRLLICPTVGLNDRTEEELAVNWHRIHYESSENGRTCESLPGHQLERNLLRWKCFMKKHQKDILSNYN